MVDGFDQPSDERLEVPKIRKGSRRSSRNSPTPSLKKRNAQRLLREHGSPPGVRVTAGGRVVSDPAVPRIASPRFNSHDNVVYAQGHAFPNLNSTNMPSRDHLRQLEGRVVVLEGRGYTLVRQGELLDMPPGFMPFDQNINPTPVPTGVAMYQPVTGGNQPMPAYASPGGVSNTAMPNQYPVQANTAPGNTGPTTQRHLASLQVAYHKLEDEYKQLDKNEVLVNQRETLTKEARQAYKKRRMELTNHMNDLRLSVKACKERLGMNPMDSTDPSAGQAAASNYRGYFQHVPYHQSPPEHTASFVPPPHVQQQMAMQSYQPLPPQQAQFGAPHVQMVHFEQGDQFDPNQASYGQGFSYPPVAPRWIPMQPGQMPSFPDANVADPNVLQPRSGGVNTYGNAPVDQVKPPQNSNAAGGLRFDGTKQSDADVAPSAESAQSMPLFQPRRRSHAVEIKKPAEPEGMGKKTLNPTSPEYQPSWAATRDEATQTSQHRHVQSVSSQGTVTGPYPGDGSNHNNGQRGDMANEQARFDKSFTNTDSSATTADFFPQSAKDHSLHKLSIDDVAPSLRPYLGDWKAKGQDAQSAQAPKTTPSKISSKYMYGESPENESYANPPNTRNRPELSIKTGQVPGEGTSAVTTRGSEVSTHVSPDDARGIGRVSRLPNSGRQSSYGVAQEQPSPSSQYRAGYECGTNVELMPEVTTLEFRKGYLDGIINSSTPVYPEDDGRQALPRRTGQSGRVPSIGRTPSVPSFQGPAPPSNSRESPLRQSFTTDENQPQTGRQGQSGESIIQHKSSRASFKYPWEEMLEKRKSSRSSLREQYKDEASPLTSRFGSPNVGVIGDRRGSGHVTPGRTPNSAPTTGHAYSASFVKRDTDSSETGNNHPGSYKSASATLPPPGFGGDHNVGAPNDTPTRKMSNYESQRYYPGKVQSSVAPSATYAKGSFPQYDGSAEDDENTSMAPAGPSSGDKKKMKPAGGVSGTGSPSKVTSGNVWFGGGSSAVKSPEKQSKGKISVSSSPMKRASSAVVKLLQFGTGSSSGSASGSWRKDQQQAGGQQQQQGRRGEQGKQKSTGANVGAGGGGGGSPSIVGGASRAPAAMGGDSASSPRTVPGQYPASTYETAPSGGASVWGGEAPASSAWPAVGSSDSWGVEPSTSAWGTADANNGRGDEGTAGNEGWGDQGGWGYMGPEPPTTVVGGGNSYGGNQGGRGAGFAKRNEEAKAEWKGRFADLKEEEQRVIADQQRKEGQGRGGRRGFGPGAHGAAAPNM
ncbi:MAG: hypothetical protein M1831_001495 [Alyxoria varia]|nr:MAG: hypothetical protein M1831_001495 [Alyxoria varia]